jgi:hypothetical protein
MYRQIARLAGLGAVVALALSGCAKGPPPMTEVSGVVLLDGQPLPQANVEFCPVLKGFGAEMNSSAVTDDQGRFTLSKSLSREPGAVVGQHRVLITERPTPGEFRNQDPQTQARYAAFMAKLKNRPIPAAYGVLATALIVEVKPEQKEYKIELKRSP